MSNQSQGSSSAPPPSPAVLDTMVRIIMGQTEMKHEEIVCALERTNYDLKRVIREYIGSGSGSGSSSSSSSGSGSGSGASYSSNQLRFSEIRNFMDKSDALYYRRQEMTKIYNQVLERKKAEAATAATAAEATATEAPTVAKL